MSDLNLNVHPYYDDFDSTKDYQKILCIPGRSAQARELTQVQTTIQYQIRKIGDSLYKNGTVLRGCSLSINSSKTQVRISAGDVYVDGFVITINEQTELPILGVGSELIGLVKQEYIITEAEDSTLRDPAMGYDSYNEPGANRLKVTWAWGIIDPTVSNEEGVSYKLSIFTIKDGSVEVASITSQDPTQQILDISAQRDYVKSGNYVLSGMKLKLIEHPTDKWDMKRLIVESGSARIQGYDVILQTNWSGDIPIARETEEVLDEPWIFVPRNYSLETGGEYRLGQRPVDSVSRVVVTVLVCDGYESRPPILRSGVPGSSDDLAETSIESIIGVNYGGTWNPTGGTDGLGVFVGGVNYIEGVDFLKDGNRIDWSPNGIEPALGVNYKVAYTYRKQLVKQIFEKNFMVGYELYQGVNDSLDNLNFCPVNDFTEAVFSIVDPIDDELPPDYLVSDYIYGTDFELDLSGVITWFNYNVEVLSITRGYSWEDVVPDMSESYSFYQILDIAYYSPGNTPRFNETTLKFDGSDYSYIEQEDYYYAVGDGSVGWWGGQSPPEGGTYSIAVRGRKYKTSNHPNEEDKYYASYTYWETKVSGDYIARDSYYITWTAPTSTNNIKQRYGTTNPDYVNFWGADSYVNNIGYMNKPYPGSLVEIDYTYCLPRYAVIELHKTDLIKVTFGQSSRHPTEPVYDEKSDSIMMGKIYLPADSIGMSITEFGVVTLKVLDLHNMKDRILRTELNLADTWLDLDAKSMEVTNKKGVSTSSFRTLDRFDLGWSGSALSIDPDWEELTLPHTDYMYHIEVDTVRSTGKVYSTIGCLVPNGTEIVEQPYYTDHESIAPYALMNQEMFLTSQSVYMNLTPSSDTLIIPRTMAFLDNTDADAWAQSDVSKLTDPSPWFTKGWRGDQQDETVPTDTIEALTNDTLSQTWSSEYLREIQGVCRRIPVIFDIPGGLSPASEVELDYFVYFGGVLVDIELLDSTPTGSAAKSFRPRLTDNGAKGRFTIPPNISEGRIEVKVISTPALINGQEWRATITAIFDAAVVEQLTMVFNRCRCNCFACNRCANCWACRGRCGTGPIAETLEPIGKNRFLKSLEVDFYSVNPKYGVYGCVIKTDNGQPTSNTVSNAMISRKFLNASQLIGGGPKLYEFDDPIYLKDECYAVVITGEDGFNVNSISEIAAGRDIRCKIATLGHQDNTTGMTVGTQPFKYGIFWRSLTGVTWEQDQLSDLKFKATFNTYSTSSTQVIQMNPVDLYDATAFICTWNSTQVQGTSIVFQYKTNQETTWTEFAPYILTKLNSVATNITFRAILSTTVPNVTPFVEKSCGLYVQSQGTVMKVVTRLFELASGEASDTLDVWINSHLPTGYTQDLRVSFNNGEDWTSLDNPVSGLPTGNLIEYSVLDLNVDNIKYKYHWKVELDPGEHFTSYRVEINSNGTGASAKLVNPRFSNYISIPSST